MDSIEPCPSCKAVKGYDWTWSKNFDNTGFSTCKGCGAKFK